MPNPHLDATGQAWTMSIPAATNVSTSSWSPAAGRDESGYQSTSPHYSGNGNDNTGVNDINTVTNEPIVVDEIPGQVLSNEDKIWELATQAAASNPGYELSYEGQKLKAAGIMPGSDQWVMHFGVPQIVTTSGRTGKPVTTGIRRGDTTTGYMDEYGQIIEGGSPIMSGQGKYLMDQYDEPGTYEEKVDDYYEMREAEQAQQPDKDPNYGYGYGYSGGSSRGTGYFGGSTGFPQVASAHRMHQGWLDTLYKGRTQPGQEVQKMLASNQKIEAANILSGLSQKRQAFAMDPKTRGILAMLQA